MSRTTARSIPRATRCGRLTDSTWSSHRLKASATASRPRAASTRPWHSGRWRCAIRIAIRAIATSTTRHRAWPRRPRPGRPQGAATPQPVEVRIDWTGMARRARQVTVPGTSMTNLTAAPEGHSIALTVAMPGVAAGRGGQGAESPSGIYIVNVESGQLTRMPSAPQTPGEGQADGAVAAVQDSAAAAIVFAKDGRTLYYRPVRDCSQQPSPECAGRRSRRRGTRRRARCGGRHAATEAAAGSTARQVDLHRQPRSGPQGPALAGLQRGLADHEKPFLRRRDARRRLERRSKDVRAAARPPRRHRGAADVMMMMIGHLNASHTGVSGGGPANTAPGPDSLSRLRSRRRHLGLLQGGPPLQGWSGRSGST